jgi:V/A-type H+-transporting ATPase subunit A
MGLDVLLLADSTSRWAQAMREMSGRLEEIPGEEAFPAYLGSRIAAFYERSGAILLNDGRTGSLTIGGSVSPAGGNFEEPVTQATLSVVGAFLGLSRERSDARRYPAIDPLISWSKYIEKAGEQMETQCPGWATMVKEAFTILKNGDDIGKRMEVVGEEGIALEDLVVFLKSDLYEFCYLQQNAFDKEDAYCALPRQIPLFKLIYTIFETKFDFTSHDQARDYFNDLKTEIKNTNYLSVESAQYIAAMKQIRSTIESMQNPRQKMNPFAVS